MLKMAKKLKARVAESERKTAAAAAEVAAEAAVAAAALAEPLASQKNRDPEKPPKSVKIPVNAGHDVPPEKLLSDKERKKLEKKLLEQRKKEKERKKLEKMMKKKKKNVPESQSEARGPEVAAAATAATAAGEDEGTAQGAAAGLGEGAAAGGTSRAWAQWDTDSDEVDDSDEDEDDAYYAPPRVGGIVWRPGPAKAGALSAHMPLVVFLVFSIRSPSWVLNFLLQRRTGQGRGCGFVFGATCCFRVFLGCAFFSFLSGRTKRRGRGHGRSRARGTGRRGRDERLI